MIPLLESPAAQRLAWTLLHFLWQGALLGLLAWAAFALLRRRRPQLRYFTGCALLVACLGAALTTYAALAPGPPAGLPSTVSVQAEPVLATPPGLAPQEAAPLPQAFTMTWRARLQPWLPWILATWAGGVLFLSLRAAGGWLWLRRLKATATPIVEPDWIQALVRKADLRRVVRFLESARVVTPMCLGLLRPVILLPLGFLANLDPLAAEAVLAHELAHIRRLDGLVNGLQCVIEVLFFFHPAVWWISRRIRTEREHCCDDAAVLACGDAVFYAETLSRLDALRDRAPSLALSARGGNLMERLRRLLLADPPQLRFATPGLTLIVALVLLGTLPVQAEKPAARPGIEAPDPAPKDPPAPPESAEAATPQAKPNQERVSDQGDTIPPAVPTGPATPTATRTATPTPIPTPTLAPSPAQPIATSPVQPAPVQAAPAQALPMQVAAPPAPAPAPAPGPAPATSQNPTLQARDLEVVPGLAIRTLRVPRYPVVIEDELLTWPDKGYAVDVPARTTVSLRVTCESGEAYFRVGVADKWGNPPRGSKGSLGVPWASYTNGSDRPVSVCFFIRTAKNYPGDGKIRVHVAAAPTARTSERAPEPVAPFRNGEPTQEEAQRILQAYADTRPWGDGVAQAVQGVRLERKERWNEAYLDQWPRKAGKPPLFELVGSLEGWLVTFQIQDQAGGARTSRTMAVLLDQNGVIHWRKGWPDLPPGLKLMDMKH